MTQPPPLGPIELEILRNALTAAAAEMDVTVWRTSRSTIVRELLDYSTAVFDRDGYNVAQSARIPQHLNSMGAGLLTLVRDFLALDRWEDGDVVITNDPYCGGQHIPDILAFRPVFADGARIAILGTLCHHLDMGGIAAGSYGATATEVFQEGLRIPPVKLVKRGVINEEVLALMRQNVRRPDMLWGDLQAQLASLAMGESNMRKLAARYGSATIVQACAQILDSSERAMRAMIGRMPDGRYEFEDFMDDDGLVDEPVRIHAAIEIRGEEMTVDLSGSGPQALGPINATLASAGSAVSYAIMAFAGAPPARPRGSLRNHGLPCRADPGERRLLPARHGDRAGGADRQRAPSRAGSEPRRRHPPARDDAAGRAAQGGAGPHPRRLLRHELRLHLPDHRRAGRAQRAGRDRGRRRRRPSGAGRAERLCLRHAQQFEHPDRDDRERAASDHHPLRAPARHRRRRTPPGRSRPRARMARGLPGGGVHGQSRAVQVPPLRPRRRRAGHARPALSRPKRRAPGAALQSRQPAPQTRRHHPPRNFGRRRLRRPGHAAGGGGRARSRAGLCVGRAAVAPAPVRPAEE